MSHGHQKVPFWKDFVAGGAAGLCEVSLMYPLDLVKTRNQLLTTKSLSMVQTLKTVFEEQGVFGAYRGIISPLMAEAPKRAWKFSMNEKFKNMLRTADGKLTNAGAAGAGALAGMSEVLINCPFEVVKVRMQAKSNLGRYKTSMDCAMQIVKQEGPLALYKGAEPQLFRNGIWNGTYFGLIDTIRSVYKPAPDASPSSALFVKFATGCVASSIATTMNTPIDVVKSRMQNVLPGQQVIYRSTLPSLVNIYQKEGFRALYKGYAARMARLVPGGGIMLVTFDVVIAWLQ